MATNNNAHTLDSAGNPAVDFVWGNQAIQPNDQRTETAASNIGGSTGDYGWSATTQVTGARLDFAGTSAYSGSNVLSNVIVKSGRHEIVETGWAGYPGYTPATGKFNVTQVDGDGTTITYQCFNFLSTGDTVDVTGCNGFNQTSATVAKATRDYFTVTASTTGSLININNGIVQRSDALTAADGSYVSAVAYINVPSVVGFTTALALDALKDAGYATSNITTASAVTPAVSNVARTGTLVTLTTAAAHGYAAGDSATIAAVTNTAVNGTFTLVSASGSTMTYNTVSSGTIASGADTGTVKVAARAGTIKTQSTAAGAASQALSATITVTPYFAS